MSNREFLKRQVKLNREKEKCPHCGGDIRDRLMTPWERTGIDRCLHGDTLPDWLIKARQEKESKT